MASRVHGVERRVAVGVDAELLDEVERSVPAGQLDDVGLALDRLEDGSPLVALDQPGDVLVDHLAPDLARDGVDELLAGQDARDVLVVEHPLGAGQAKGGAGDDDRFGQGWRRAPLAGVAGPWRSRAASKSPASQRPRRMRRPRSMRSATRWPSSA